MTQQRQEDILLYTAMNSSFVTLLGKGTNLKQRSCLRCSKKFRSLNNGHRVCANCKRVNAKVSSLHSYRMESA